MNTSPAFEPTSPTTIGTTWGVRPRDLPDDIDNPPHEAVDPRTRKGTRGTREYPVLAEARTKDEALEQHVEVEVGLCTTGSSVFGAYVEGPTKDAPVAFVYGPVSRLAREVIARVRTEEDHMLYGLARAAHQSALVQKVREAFGTRMPIPVSIETTADLYAYVEGRVQALPGEIEKAKMRGLAKEIDKIIKRDDDSPEATLVKMRPGRYKTGAPPLAYARIVRTGPPPPSPVVERKHSEDRQVGALERLAASGEAQAAAIREQNELNNMLREQLLRLAQGDMTGATKLERVESAKGPKT